MKETHNQMEDVHMAEETKMQQAEEEFSRMLDMLPDENSEDMEWDECSLPSMNIHSKRSNRKNPVKIKFNFKSANKLRHGGIQKKRFLDAWRLNVSSQEELSNLQECKSKNLPITTLDASTDLGNHIGSNSNEIISRLSSKPTNTEMTSSQLSKREDNS